MPDHGGAGDAATSESAAVLWELAASGVEVDGRLQVGTSTWFVYGHTSYDGEVVVGRYEHAVDAEEALRCAPPPRSGPGRHVR
jgi:hypothetical protein